MTPESLERAAFDYLARYAAATSDLRRILMRRVERSIRMHGTDRATAEEWVDELIARCHAAGLLDDESYAHGKARRQLKRGASIPKVRAALAAKGLDRDLIEATLKQLHGEDADLELNAARAYARRRRIGPYRQKAERMAWRAKDLAKLGRAGFSFEIARRVLETEFAETLEGDPTR